MLDSVPLAAINQDAPDFSQEIESRLSTIQLTCLTASQAILLSFCESGFRDGRLSPLAFRSLLQMLESRH